MLMSHRLLAVAWCSYCAIGAIGKSGFESGLCPPLSKALYHICVICGQRCKWWACRPKLSSSVISDVKSIIYIYILYLHPFEYVPSYHSPVASRRHYSYRRGGDIDNPQSTYSEHVTFRATRISNTLECYIIFCLYICKPALKVKIVINKHLGSNSTLWSMLSPHTRVLKSFVLLFYRNSLWFRDLLRQLLQLATVQHPVPYVHTW